MNRPRSICFVIPGLGAGGAERVMSILANNWVARGTDVSAVTLDSPDSDSFFPLHPSIRLFRLDLSSESRSLLDAIRANLVRTHRLRSAMMACRPDIVISFVDTTNVLAILALLGSGISVIACERNDPRHHTIPRPWRHLRQFSYRLADGVVAQTKEVADFMTTRFNLPVTAIPNPVPCPPQHKPKNAMPVVLAVGRLAKQKGFDLLIEAFAMIAPRHPEWTLSIVGEGEDRAALEALASQLGLSNRIKLPGLAADMTDIYNAAGIFVLSSRYEGFPNVLCEAMAHGLPVVSFACPSGPAEIVRSEIDGLLVPPDNVESLANAMSRLMADASLRHDLATNAASIHQRFSITECLAAWDSLIDAVLARKVLND